MDQGALDRRLHVATAHQGPVQPTVIEPPRRWPGFGLAEFWQLRRICLVLARRSLMVRYRQTLIGVSWSLLQPILLMIAFSVFFGILARMPTGGMPFPVFFFIGLVPMQMASKILTEGSTSVIANAGLLTRVYFPRAYFPTAVALAALIDLALAFGAMAILLLWFNVVPGSNVAFVPILIAIGWTSALGVAYWLSALNVAYRDVTQLLPFLAQLWMFTSPVIYSSTLVPESFRPIYFVNPMALVIEGFRWSIAGGAPPPPYAWGIGVAVAALSLGSGYLFFRRREPGFADVV
jgi:lipopolysaccharide transport system permease protein